MPIDLRHHVAAAKGQELKFVACENCRVEFVYLLARHAEGWATGVMFLDGDAPRRAVRQANEELCRALAQDQDPVPCPACGWYQKYMVPLVRAQHRGWMSVIGVFLLYAAALVAALGAVRWAVTADPAAARGSASFVEAGAWVAAAGIGLIMARRALAAGVRPNEGDPEARKKLARRRALTRAEFDQLAAAWNELGSATSELKVAADRRRQRGSEQ